MACSVDWKAKGAISQRLGLICGVMLKRHSNDEGVLCYVVKNLNRVDCCN